MFGGCPYNEIDKCNPDWKRECTACTFDQRSSNTPYLIPEEEANARVQDKRQHEACAESQRKYNGACAIVEAQNAVKCKPDSDDEDCDGYESDDPMNNMGIQGSLPDLRAYPILEEFDAAVVEFILRDTMAGMTQTAIDSRLGCSISKSQHNRHAKDAPLPTTLPEGDIWGQLTPDDGEDDGEFQEANIKAKEEAAIKAQKEAETKAKKEAEIKAKEKAAIQAQKEAAIKAKEEAATKAKKEAAIKAQKEAETKAKKEAETKAKEEAEIKAKEKAAIKAKAKREAKAQSAKDLATQEAHDKIELRRRRELERKRDEATKVRAERVGETHTAMEIDETETGTAGATGATTPTPEVTVFKEVLPAAGEPNHRIHNAMLPPGRRDPEIGPTNRHPVWRPAQPPPSGEYNCDLRSSTRRTVDLLGNQSLGGTILPRRIQRNLDLGRSNDARRTPVTAPDR
jgi:hypothetical protein